MEHLRHGHGIEDEGHRHDGEQTPDPAEQKAEGHLQREVTSRDGEEELARHSVFNEPGAIFPSGSPAHRAGLTDRDWSCDHCGYNMRGIEAGATCPECGRVSLSRPAPLEPISYASWLRKKLDERRERSAVGWVVGLVVIGGFGAVISSGLLEIFGAADHILGLVLIAPIMEEAMKVALLAALVERKPYLFRSGEQIIGIAVATALLFATIENALYLLVYAAKPSGALIVWRVVVCTTLHVGCTTLAATGLAAAWRKSAAELREPQLDRFTRLLIAAIVMHGVYNAAAYSLQLMGMTL